MERGYRSLTVWRRSRALAIEVYRATALGEFRKEWGLRDQIRRSALSVPSNIAEGAARGSDRDSSRFFLIARGSLAELATQADIACEVGLLDSSLGKAWQKECQELGAMLTRLVIARR
jgi:four helix bundle protein